MTGPGTGTADVSSARPRKGRLADFSRSNGCGIRGAALGGRADNMSAVPG
jgi:hypothetical protein